MFLNHLFTCLSVGNRESLHKKIEFHKMKNPGSLSHCMEERHPTNHEYLHFNFVNLLNIVVGVTLNAKDDLVRF